MASFTLKNEALFPVGTSVTAYPQSNWPMARRPPSGAPIGAAAETQVVGAGGAAFAALADATNYYAYASSPDRYVAFRTSAAAAAAGGGSGSVATDAIFDAKGDLAVATAADTAARVPVGADGLVLTADASQSAGVRWGPVLSDQRAVAGRPGIAETFSRVGNTLAVGNIGASGVLRLCGFMVFRAGVPVTSLACIAGTTSAAAPTNQWFCVVRVSDLTVRAVTTDDTTTAWNAQATKTLNIAGGPWTPTQVETCYFGIVVVATTVPNVYGVGMGNQTVLTVPPIICGPSTTGLTGPVAVGTVVAALTSTTALHNAWAWAN